MMKSNSDKVKLEAASALLHVLSINHANTGKRISLWLAFLCFRVPLSPISPTLKYSCRMRSCSSLDRRTPESKTERTRWMCKMPRLHCRILLAVPWLCHWSRRVEWTVSIAARERICALQWSSNNSFEFIHLRLDYKVLTTLLVISRWTLCLKQYPNSLIIRFPQVSNPSSPWSPASLIFSMKIWRQTSLLKHVPSCRL